MRILRLTTVVLLASLVTTGCVLVAAGGAGYAVHDEVSEGDGKFDVLEKARGKENESN